MDFVGYVVKPLLAIFGIAFLYWFGWRSLKVGRTLGLVTGRIDELVKNSVNEPAKVREVFGANRRLQHLWDEYAETLHRQELENSDGPPVVTYRATAPADAYFSTHAVIDVPLGTAFFKHLPGICTGLGIIGTFNGIILGLRGFKYSQDASAVGEQVAALMGHVKDAFEVSFVAILVAILITFAEKIAVSWVSSRLLSMVHAIDHLYRSGVAEEYIARLVKASEDSATQAKILKDALVEDLRAVMVEVGNRQIDGQRESVSQMATHVEAAITNSLASPMSKIAATVEKASGTQLDNAAEVLQDVVSQVTSRMDEVFGGQIKSINEVNQRAAQTMTDAVSALQALVGQMEQGSRQGTEAIATTLTESIAALKAEQLAMQERMREFVDQIAGNVDRSQSETQARIQNTLELVSSQTATLVQELTEGHKQISAVTRRRQEEFLAHTAGAVDSMTGSVDAAVTEIAEAATRISDYAGQLAATTTSAIQGMNAGAARLSTTVDKFASASSGVADVMKSTQTVSSKLTELTGAMVAGAGALQATLRDYEASRASNQAIFSEFKQTVELARREASVTKDVLERLEASAGRLKSAQLDAEKYLDGVSEVLEEAQQGFHSAVSDTLKQVNGQFHESLVQAVNVTASAVTQLEDSIEELQNTLQTLQPKR